MKILVCVSRTPDTATRVAVGADGKSINKEGVKFIINPYDEFALEEGIRLREKNGGEVNAITVGSSDSSDILRTALAMGVDNAYLVKSNESLDSFAVANEIAKIAKDTNPDLILLGRQSIDFDSYQMASLLAEILDLPSVSVVSKLDINGTNVVAERDIEGGKETVETNLPAVISVQKGINEPRYPKLPDIMKAKKKPITESDASSNASRTEILNMDIPSKSRANKILTDSDADIDTFIKLLREEAKVI